MTFPTARRATSTNHRHRSILALAALLGVGLILSGCGESGANPAAPQSRVPAANPQAAIQSAPVQDPASGHYYQRIDDAVSWTDARTAAEQMMFQGVAGHLATISSQEENDFVFSLFVDQEGGYKWLGGFQPPGSSEPAGGWAWVTGQPWAYTNWNQGEPSDYGANEHHLAFYAGAPYVTLPEGGKWNDLPNDGGVSIGGTLPLSYVVEFDIAPSTLYPFIGFLRPIDNQPTVNVAKAGSAIPVKFSLGGDRGLGIFAPGSPASTDMACDSGAPTNETEQTVSAGGSGLSYDPATQVYTYVWKTQKSWADTCRLLSVTLTDGSVHLANFRFK